MRISLSLTLLCERKEYSKAQLQEWFRTLVDKGILTRAEVSAWEDQQPKDDPVARERFRLALILGVPVSVLDETLARLNQARGGS